ncbi:hypothetical protein AAHA92_15611 [Salvia divinorum]|uniref:Uncharacterized protein n=1 Tax=Salvia divinorum TaxID=28513 RepID=A0ABD1HF96_SALDI
MPPKKKRTSVVFKVTSLRLRRFTSNGDNRPSKPDRFSLAIHHGGVFANQEYISAVLNRSSEPNQPCCRARRRTTQPLSSSSDQRRSSPGRRCLFERRSAAAVHSAVAREVTHSLASVVSVAELPSRIGSPVVRIKVSGVQDVLIE